MTDKCMFCNGTGKEPGHTDCGWCDNTGLTGHVRASTKAALDAIQYGTGLLMVNPDGAQHIPLAEVMQEAPADFRQQLHLQIGLLDWNRAQVPPPITIACEYAVANAAFTLMQKCATCQGNGVIGWTTGQTPESFDQGEAPCPDCMSTGFAHSSGMPIPGTCETCKGTGTVDDGELTHSAGGIPYECGPIKCVKDCPDCKPPVVQRFSAVALRFATTSAKDYVSGEDYDRAVAEREIWRKGSEDNRVRANSAEQALEQEREVTKQLKSDLAEARHLALEFSGVIDEYQSMPCTSLLDRMFKTLDRYRKRVQSHKNAHFAALAACAQNADGGERVIHVDPGSPEGDRTCKVEGKRLPDGSLLITSIEHIDKKD